MLVGAVQVVPIALEHGQFDLLGLSSQQVLESILLFGTCWSLEGLDPHGQFDHRVSSHSNIPSRLKQEVLRRKLIQ